MGDESVGQAEAQDGGRPPLPKWWKWAILLLLVALVVLLVVILAEPTYLGTRSRVGAEHVAATNNCDNAASADSTMGQQGCQFNGSGDGAPDGAAEGAPDGSKKRPDKEPHLYLVGNSVAAMYSEALVGASDTLNIPLTLLTGNGCFLAGGGKNRDCSDDFRRTINQIIQRAPGLVVMSSTWDLGSYGGGESAAKILHEKAQRLIGGLTGVISRLRAAGNQVLVVLPTPRFFHGSTPGTYVAAPSRLLSRIEAHSSSWKPKDCPTSVAQNVPAGCGATVPQAQEDDAQAITIEALKKVAERTGATALDLRSRYCWGGLCRTNNGNRWMFEDGIHISVAESRSLAPEFARIIARVFSKKEWWVPPTERSQSGERAPTSPEA